MNAIITDAVIIIPNLSDEDQVCDFLLQTAQILANTNVVVIPIFNKKARSHRNKDGIYFVKPTEVLPLRRFSIVNCLNKIIFFVGLQLWLKIKYPRLRKKYVWMFFPHLADLVRIKIPGWKIVFDIVDFHYSPSKKELVQINTQKKLILKKSDAVFSISQPLKKINQPFAKKRIKVVPQGFDLESFKKNSQLSKLKLPQAKPIIGFVGQMSERLDFNLLNQLIKNNPQWNFIFIGPVHHEPNVATDFNQKKLQLQISSLFKNKNAFHFERQPKTEILSLLKKFDICLVPYDVGLPFNRYSYPMKIFEYFYAGKPIVSTPIEALKQFPDLIALSENDAEFTAAIKKILKKPWPKSKVEQQQELAEKNSWESKLGQMSHYL